MKAGRREWIGLAVIALPCMLYSMDLTVLNLAVPAISADLQPTSTQLLWILDIYGFLVASSLITMGTLGDRIGRRRLLLIGAALFGVTSILAAFSTSPEMLIVARALLGLAGATLAPSTLSLIRHMFLDPAQRTLAIGVWVTSYSVGGALGPILGGIVLQHYWWGSAFLIGVPVMVLLLIVGPILLPEFRDPKVRRLDLLSAALSLAAVLLVIYGLKRFAADGPSWISGLAAMAGVLVGMLFVHRQRRLADPFLDLQLFRSAPFSASLAAYTLATFISFGGYIFIAQYLQLVLGLSPLEAGLWTVPLMCAYIVGSLMVPALARRFTSAQVMSGGLVLSVVGFLLLAGLGNTTSLTLLLLASIVYSLGVSPVVILATDLIVGSAPIERAGAASAISETSSELGGALGIAVLGSIGGMVYRQMMLNNVPAGIPPSVAESARGTLGAAIAEAAALPGAAGSELVAAARTAFSHSFAVVALISAAIALGTAIFTAVLLRGVRRE
ncbi:MAG TPA: MFS transporter [Gemmatimonadales bacterium]|nr:MFS transporter [Gemmatimonadales bacterium]